MNQIIKIFVILALMTSCSEKNNVTEFEKNLSQIQDWDFKLTFSKSDTNNLTDWLPEPEVSIIFDNKNDTSSLSPVLNFYPTELKDYIEKKLIRYLILRATLFPPAPNKYINENYFILGWNFTDFDTFHCIECDSLEQRLIKDLNLKMINRMN